MQIRTTQLERESIDNRLAMLSGSETIRGTPLGGLAHAARVYLADDAFETLCKQAGFESARFSPLLKYKLSQFLVLERDTALAMSRSGLSFEKAIHRIGGAAIDVFFDSVAGRTMRILAEGEPHRLLGAVANGYGLLVNFGNRTYRRTGERSCDFVFSKEYLGAVHTAGIFESSFERVYGLPLKIDLHAVSAVDFTFHLAW
jgi:uncharacterized protein (TIGR02265 family)